MRQGYLRQGGSDPEVLALMADLEIEALTLSNKHSDRNKDKGVVINFQVYAFLWNIALTDSDVITV